MKSPWLCAVLALVGAPLTAQTPPAAPAAPAAPAEPAPKPARTIEFTGQILINGFFNNARVNNSDVPQFALADTNAASGGGGTLRQTRLGVIVTEPDVLGGTGGAEVDVDFFGGQSAAGGRTFPVLRLRRALAS